MLEYVPLVSAAAGSLSALNASMSLFDRTKRAPRDKSSYQIVLEALALAAKKQADPTGDQKAYLDYICQISSIIDVLADFVARRCIRRVAQAAVTVFALSIVIYLDIPDIPAEDTTMHVLLGNLGKAANIEVVDLLIFAAQLSICFAMLIATRGLSPEDRNIFAAQQTMRNFVDREVLAPQISSFIKKFFEDDDFRQVAADERELLRTLKNLHGLMREKGKSAW